MASQAGHAFLDAFLQAQSQRPETIAPYKLNHGIKIAMGAKSLAHLELAHREALEAGIPAVIITDLGYFGVSEELKNKPNITALGIGPARKEEVARILKRFQLLK
jgi:peptidyl-tRNA hydrolase